LQLTHYFSVISEDITIAKTRFFALHFSTDSKSESKSQINYCDVFVPKGTKFSEKKPNNGH